MAKSDIKGMAELEKTIKKLGQLPQKCVTKAARQGANVALKSAKATAPRDKGNLKKGLKLKGEKLKEKGKKVYQVSVDPNGDMNDIFAKQSADGKKRYYYPASQEYGFITKDGGYVQGKRYLKNSLVSNKSAIEQKVVDVLAKEIDKLK